MFCKKCGNELKDGLNFCTVCGAETNNVQSGDVPVSKQVTPQHDNARLNNEELALIYVKEYEDMAIMILILALIAFCLPLPFIRFVLVIIASIQMSKTRKLPVYSIKLNDINLIVRSQSAKRKIKTADKLITVTYVLIFVPAILVIIAAIFLLGIFSFF